MDELPPSRRVAGVQLWAARLFSEWLEKNGYTLHKDGHEIPYDEALHLWSYK